MNSFYNDVGCVFDLEIAALEEFKNNYDSQIQAISVIIECIAKCKGLVVVSGLGKSGHIANKISATMASLGIKSIFLHPVEALHGDFGRVSKGDFVLVFSNGGNTQEVCEMVAQLNRRGIENVAITANVNSYIYRYCTYRILLPNVCEACHLGLAPTSSTTLQLVLGDALAISASKYKGFTKNDFALNHPSGSLGKRLTMYVKDVMHFGAENPVVSCDCLLKDALVKLSEYGLGAINIVDSNNNLVGLITDGDLKRMLNRQVNVYSCSVSDVMTRNPLVIGPEVLALKALQIMENRLKQISVLPVVEDGKAIGMVRIHDLLSLGLV